MAAQPFFFTPSLYPWQQIAPERRDLTLRFHNVKTTSFSGLGVAAFLALDDAARDWLTPFRVPDQVFVLVGQFQPMSLRAYEISAGLDVIDGVTIIRRAVDYLSGTAFICTSMNWQGDTWTYSFEGGFINGAKSFSLDSSHEVLEAKIAQEEARQR